MATKKAQTTADVPEGDKAQAKAAIEGEPKPAAEAKGTSTKAATFAEAAKKVDPRYADHPGFVGEVPDETPNEHYTVAGQLAGKPTPETSTDRKK